MQWVQCFKMVFLEIPNVSLAMVFAETVTYIDYNDIIVDLIIEVRESI